MIDGGVHAAANMVAPISPACPGSWEKVAPEAMAVFNIEILQKYAYSRRR